MIRIKESYRVISFLIALSLLVLGLPSSAFAGGGSILHAVPVAVGAGDCTSWADACTLQEALDTASSGNEIWVKAGVHYPGTDRNDTFLMDKNITVLGGFAGTETSDDQRNWLVNRTILSGDIDKNDLNSDGNFIAETAEDILGLNAYHVVVADGTVIPRLNGFIITAGHASGSGDNGCGGGMYNNQDTDLRLTNLVLSGNWARCGGGIYNDWGAISILTNVTFTGNEAGDVGGGGMYNDEGSDVTLTGVAFKNNMTEHVGGGIANVANNLTLTNVTFSGNQASAGGGIANSEGASPTLINVTFSGNTATYSGGGINNHMYSSPMLINVIMWGDHAPNGREIHNTEESYPDIEFSDIQGSGGSSAWDTALGVNNGHNIDADPHFIAPALGNLRLHWASPAIDAGINSAVPAGILTDLDGNLRFVDLPFRIDTGFGPPPIVDMGAYETQALFPVFMPLVMR